jgi:UPF0755 protein
MFKALEDKYVCFAEDLWEAVANETFDYTFLKDAPALGDRHRLEGFLFPDTYTFYVNDSPTRVLKKMLDNFKTKFKQEYIDLADERGMTVRQIVNVAAMIEREAGADSDRPLIASVIYNRLKSTDFPHLEIDATIYYAIAETDEVFSKELDSPYNTYLHEGQPPGPISNPGLKSIKAALAPAETKFYYYALSKEGRHEFFKTYEEHQKFVNSDLYAGE